MGETARSFRLRQLAALAAVYLVWGSTYLAIRVAVTTLPPFLMAGVRFVTAGMVLFLWSLARGGERPRLRHWRPALVIGALLLLCGNGAVVWAEQRLPSGLTALLIGTEPLWVALLLWIGPDRRRPRLPTTAGLLLGFLGAAVLATPAEVIGGVPVHLLSALAVVFACLAWAGGSLYARRAALPSSPSLATSMQMLAGGGLLLLFGLLRGEAAGFAVRQVSLASLVALLYLTLFGSLVAFSAYAWLIRTTEPTLVSTYAYVNPVIAVYVGWLLGGEPVGWKTLGAAVLIITSVVLVSVAEARRVRRARDAAVLGEVVATAPDELERCA